MEKGTNDDVRKQIEYATEPSPHPKEKDLVGIEEDAKKPQGIPDPLRVGRGHLAHDLHGLPPELRLAIIIVIVISCWPEGRTPP